MNHRQYYGKKKEKYQKNGTQSTTQKTKHIATSTPLKTGDEHKCSGRISK